VLSLRSTPQTDPNTIGLRRNAGEQIWIPPAADGTFVIEVGQTERIDVQLPPPRGGDYVGYRAVDGGGRQPLPVGTWLDEEAGTFAWHAAPGFLGRYDLVFAPGGDDRLATRLAIVIGPTMRVALEGPASDHVVQPFQVSGWAIDLASRGGSGVDTIHVWAFPVFGGQPVFLGVADQSGKREDVAKTYGPAFVDSAFSVAVQGLTPGLYDIVVYVHRAASGRFEAEQGRRVMVW
jgi:hypothetical protein